MIAAHPAGGLLEGELLDGGLQDEGLLDGGLLEGERLHAGTHQDVIHLAELHPDVVHQEETHQDGETAKVMYMAILSLKDAGKAAISLILE